MVYLPDVPKTVTNTIPLNFPEPQVSTPLCSDKSGQKPLSAGWGFACGVLMSLLAGALIYFLEVKPLQQQLATLAATPEGAVQLWLTKPERESYGQHLNRLENLPVAGVLQMADASLTIARQRWPGDPNQIQESQRWEQLLEARRGTHQARDSYFRVQQLLRALSAKLIEQEQQRGSLTISWLKTAVYEMQSEMNREVPLEELLRQLSISLQQKKTASPALLKQTDERWQALLSQYHQLMQRETPTH